jgi:hypothetical protein
MGVTWTTRLPFSTGIGATPLLGAHSPTNAGKGPHGDDLPGSQRAAKLALRRW